MSKYLELFDYNETVSDLEREWRFDEAVQELKKAISQFEQSGAVSFSHKKQDGKRIKTIALKWRGGSGNFFHPFVWAGSICLKMGIQFALDYWSSLKNSPYYEDKSEFKLIVDGQYDYVLEMRDKGYVYKPNTKVNQAKFLEYASKKGWR